MLILKMSLILFLAEKLAEIIRKQCKEEEKCYMNIATENITRFQCEQFKFPQAPPPHIDPSLPNPNIFCLSIMIYFIISFPRYHFISIYIYKAACSCVYVYL